MAICRIVVFHMLFLWVSFFLLSASATVSPPAQPPSGAVVPKFASKPACQSSCGNLTIPFPFGMEEGCYIDDRFLILCNDPKNPTLAKSYNFQANTRIKVLNITLDGNLRVSVPGSYDCYNGSWNQVDVKQDHFSFSFPLSYSRNKLTSVGCVSSASLFGSTTIEDDGSLSECSSECKDMSDVVNGSCSGNGCCQNYIPKELKDYWMSISLYVNPANVSRFSPCSYGFIVEQNHYNFSSSDLVDLQNGSREFPVMLDWAVGNTTCEEAKKVPKTYACRDSNSFCSDFDNGPGYRCNCSLGYHGNPYLTNGCKDIDECLDSSLHNCLHAKSCINRLGSYVCSCPRGFRGDGRKDGQGCMPDHMSWNNTIIGISVCFLAALVAVSYACTRMRSRSNRQIRERLFQENGGLLLEEMLSKTDQSKKGAKIFTEKELKKATKNFNRTEIVGVGGHGVVYKGTLKDGRTVAIKKSKMMDPSQIPEFINEVIVLSQVNHPHVVKLLGCCLETPVPLLVYEFVTNSTLYHHLHAEGKESSMSWNTRLRIAAETAGALAHMHYDASMQIIHRDIKSANILLDDNFTAKISDFGISRLVPLDQTQLSTVVQGTIGYIDPQYFETGLLNEKSDVYSFGVILAELLTGKPVVSPQGSSNREKVLSSLFTCSVENGEVVEIIEERVKNEGEEELLVRVAELTQCCLNRYGAERPTMKDVKKELEEYLKLCL